MKVKNEIKGDEFRCDCGNVPAVADLVAIHGPWYKYKCPRCEATFYFHKKSGRKSVFPF